MTLIIGCDPGKSGALALLDNQGQLLEVIDMPVIGNIISPVLLDEVVWERMESHRARFQAAVIEDVHAMPGQGVSSSFSFGRSLGVVEGVLAAGGWAIHYVSPAKWKKQLGLSADKGMSRRRAIELWPAKADLFKRAKDDGRAEAALIGLWFIQHGQGRAVTA